MPRVWPNKRIIFEDHLEVALARWLPSFLVFYWADSEQLHLLFVYLGIQVGWWFHICIWRDFLARRAQGYLITVVIGNLPAGNELSEQIDNAN